MSKGMQKIASPAELQNELQRLLDSCQGIVSRAAVARDLKRLAARLDGPKPEFAMGDLVQVMDGPDVILEGEVYSVEGFDDFLGDRRYKVKPSGGGSARTYNGKSLRKAPKVKPLTERDLKPGLLIEQSAHPEYGVWKVKDRAKGTTRMWNITRPGRGDSMVLDAADLEFWRRATR